MNRCLISKSKSEYIYNTNKNIDKHYMIVLAYHQQPNFLLINNITRVFVTNGFWL